MTPSPTSSPSLGLSLIVRPAVNKYLTSSDRESPLSSLRPLKRNFQNSPDPSAPRPHGPHGGASPVTEPANVLVFAIRPIVMLHFAIVQGPKHDSGIASLFPHRMVGRVIPGWVWARGEICGDMVRPAVIDEDGGIIGRFGRNTKYRYKAGLDQPLPRALSCHDHGHDGTQSWKQASRRLARINTTQLEGSLQVGRRDRPSPCLEAHWGRHSLLCGLL